MLWSLTPPRRKVNVMGVLHVCQAFLPHLRAAGGGATIVNISSVLGGFVVPYRSVCTSNRSAGVALHRSLDNVFHY